MKHFKGRRGASDRRGGGQGRGDGVCREGWVLSIFLGGGSARNSRPRMQTNPQTQMFAWKTKLIFTAFHRLSWKLKHFLEGIRASRDCLPLAKSAHDTGKSVILLNMAPETPFSNVAWENHILKGVEDCRQRECHFPRMHQPNGSQDSIRNKRRDGMTLAKVASISHSTTMSSTQTFGNREKIKGAFNNGRDSPDDLL